MDRKELRERLDCFRQADLPRLRRLGAYFAGQHRILSERKEPGKPDNRLVNNFCRSITDSTVGYFMGIPVSYGGDDPETLAVLNGVTSTGTHCVLRTYKDNHVTIPTGPDDQRQVVTP